MGFYSMNQFNIPGYIHGNMWIRLKIIHEVVLDSRRVTKKKLDLYNIEELQPRKTRELNIKHGSSLLFIVFWDVIHSFSSLVPMPSHTFHKKMRPMRPDKT